jgi:hypothetical protein
VIACKLYQLPCYEHICSQLTQTSRVDPLRRDNLAGMGGRGALRIRRIAAPRI